jgi:hypothetical protein
MRSFTGQYQIVCDSVTLACPKDTRQNEAPLPRFYDVACPFWHFAGIFTQLATVTKFFSKLKKASNRLVFLKQQNNKKTR